MLHVAIHCIFSKEGGVFGCVRLSVLYVLFGNVSFCQASDVSGTTNLVDEFCYWVMYYVQSLPDYLNLGPFRRIP
jgi:hypothetical protein